MRKEKKKDLGSRHRRTRLVYRGGCQVRKSGIIAWLLPKCPFVSYAQGAGAHSEGISVRTSQAPSEVKDGVLTRTDLGRRKDGLL